MLLQRIFVLVTLFLFALSAPAWADEYFTLIVSGASGGSDYVEIYNDWRQRLVSALRARPDFRDDHLLILAEKPGPGVGRASREGVAQAFRELKDRMSDLSVLLVVLIGHGSYDNFDAKFNLVGPDLEADEWSELLDSLPGKIVFVNTTASSFPFVSRLARPGRLVVTATSSAAQQYDTVFPEFLIEALIDDASDLNRDGRISVAELFNYASSGVRRWFQRQGRLATERALLDDIGDGHGYEMGLGLKENSLSSWVFVGAGVDPGLGSSDIVLSPLIERRISLERDVTDLKSRKEEMDSFRYAKELETLLIELALVSHKIRTLVPSS